MDGGDGSDLIMLRSDAGGAADVTYDGSDSLTVTLAEDYTGAEDYELVQDGSNVQLVVDGRVLAVLRDTLVADVGTVTLVREAVSG